MIHEFLPRIHKNKKEKKARSMEVIFKTLGNHIYTQNNHHLFVIEWPKIAPLCKKWKRNRDCDKSRIDEMEVRYNEGVYIPKLIHLAEVENEGLVCYDGNHRRELFTRVLKQSEGSECIVDVMFNASQHDVYTAFENINKSVQLPAIFLDDEEEEESGSKNKDKDNLKNDILGMVRTFEVKYKPFLSTSSRCRAPQFNRDSFIDNVYDIIRRFDYTISVDEIYQCILQLNREYGKGNMGRPHSAYTKRVIEKCSKYDFWIFLENSIPFEHVKNIHDKRLKIQRCLVKQ